LHAAIISRDGRRHLRRQEIRQGHGGYQCIDAVKYTTMTGQNTTAVFDICTAFSMDSNKSPTTLANTSKASNTIDLNQPYRNSNCA